MPSPTDLSRKFLPNETLLSIFRTLTKADLKALRLVCKKWSPLGNGLLFDRVFISPHSRDLDVFTNITGHHSLNLGVKSVLYDLSRFDTRLTKDDYFSQLQTQTRDLISHVVRDFLLAKSCPQMAEFVRFVRRLDLPENEQVRTVGDFNDYETINEGFRWYTISAKQQEKVFAKDEIAVQLLLGLKHLPMLQHVGFYEGLEGPKLQGLYDLDGFNSMSTQPISSRLQGPPLARSLHPLFLQPCFDGERDVCDDVNLVVRSLSLTQKTINSLRFPTMNSLQPENFNSQISMTEALLNHTINALRHVQELDITVFSKTMEMTKPDTLPRIFQSITDLRRLTFVGPFNSGEDTDMRTVFGSSPLPWKKLSHLKLGCITETKNGLLTFLQAQPALRHLSLLAFSLSEGTLAGLFDGMRNTLHLESLNISRGGDDPSGLDFYTVDGLPEKIKTFVLHGGPNPFNFLQEEDDESTGDLLSIDHEDTSIGEASG
ncbi:hypothetical protein MMC06_006633 [Schaereria dolodes]|nr:hypothetical protein [Schaereria dolodes]